MFQALSPQRTHPTHRFGSPRPPIPSSQVTPFASSSHATTPAKDKGKQPEGVVKGRVYAIMPSQAEEQASNVVVEGMVLLQNTWAKILFDSGSTHSYICTLLVVDLGLEIEPLGYALYVASPVETTLNVDKVCKDCVICIDDHDVVVDLLVMDFKDYDILLGMEWPSVYHALLDCYQKKVTFRDSKGKVFSFQGERNVDFSCLIKGLLVKGWKIGKCSGSLAAIQSKEKKGEKPISLSVVDEFPEVFPDDLPGLTPKQEIEFTIDLIPRTEPISISPYCMAPAELK